MKGSTATLRLNASSMPYRRTFKSETNDAYLEPVEVDWEQLTE